MPRAKEESIGLFPLGLVVFPGEQTRLHIFEPRYKQLINDCFANGWDFGIPVVLDGNLTGFGTRVKLVDVERFYPDGKMDILVEGVSVIRITSFESQLANKLYSGGEIDTINVNPNFPKKHELLHLYADFNRLTGAVDEQYGYDVHTSIYEMADMLRLDNKTKFKILTTFSREAIQNILINALRIRIAMHEQEEELDNQFFLN